MVDDLTEEYETVKDENTRLKSDAAEASERIKCLERQLSESSGIEKQRKKILEVFQEEFKNVQDKINIEWEKKYSVIQ